MVVTDGLNDSKAPGLVIQSLTKSFVGRPALVGLNLTLAAGEIHALVGENGSGKSTTIKILSGFHKPDPGGSVDIGGSRLKFGSPESSLSLGARFVHQDLGLVASLRVSDNMSLSAGYPTAAGIIRDRSNLRTIEKVLVDLSIDVNPRALVADLSPAERTAVAIARAMRNADRGDVRLLVLDEPTATMPQHDVEHLLRLIRSVAQRGVSILYVTHRLDEVFEIADRLTVLRDGRVAGVREVSALTRPELVRLLIGRELDGARSATRVAHTEDQAVVLTVRDLADGALTDINFTLRRGEIVGIAGITGSGRETLLRSIFDSTTRSGAVEVGGGQLPAGRPDLAVKHGLAFLPADRRRLASFQGLDATANLSIGDLGRFKRRGRISRRAERTEARKWFQLFDVRPKGAIGARLSSFSGGNQQKILLAKWFRLRPDALLLDEPTQGVDIGAKAEIHTQIRAAADDGAGVLVASSDVDELFALCSRVIVLRNGHLVIDQPTTVLTAAEIGHECLGADSTGSNNDRIN